MRTCHTALAIIAAVCALAIGAASANAAPREVAAGYDFTCGLQLTFIKCWGDNANGQTTPPGGTYSQLDAGFWEACARATSGAVKCWGDNSGGIVSEAPTSTDFAQVAAGWGTGCGVKTDNSLVCWGRNNRGQKNVPAGAYTRVAAGTAGVCAINTDQKIKCWGYQSGNLGLGGPLYPDDQFSQVEVGEYNACAVRTGGASIHCWGPYSYNLPQPPPPPAGAVWTQVAVGTYEACALADTGEVQCWIFNGTPGDGYSFPAGSYTRLSMGGHGCAVKPDDTLTCAGSNYSGQLGAAPTIDNTPPLALQNEHYSFKFSGAAIPAVTYSFVGGTLPPGLTLASDGTLSGTPTTGGSFTFTVNASNEFFAPDATKQVTMEVKRASGTDLSISPSSSVKGQAVTLVATVTAAPFAPTGTVTFKNGTTTLGTANVTSSGTAALVTSALPAGSHTLSAEYGGDTNYGPSSEAASHVVGKAATATSVTSSAAATAYGEPVTFTATVAVQSPGAGTPTGTVTFKDGGTVLGTVAVDGTGKATYATSALGVSSHTITASYGGSSDYEASTGTLPGGHDVDEADTTTTVTSSDNPSVRGQDVTFTATVASVAPGAGTPDGTVTFKDGSTTIGSDTLDASGVAAVTTDDLAVGSHSITAEYAGAATFDPSGGNLAQQAVNKAATTTSVSTSPDPAVRGQEVVFTATVAPVAPGAGQPSGNVTFTDGTTTIGTVALGAGGTATLTTDDLTVGDHDVAVAYEGDGDFIASTGSLADDQTVAKADTKTTVASSDNPSVRGQSVTFTAGVTVDAPGAGTPTGVVTFMDGTTTIGTGTLDGSGTATLTTDELSVGDHDITAKYGADSDFATSSASLGGEQVVAESGTTTALVSADDSTEWGEPVSLTAKVAPVAPGAGDPGGTVTFKDGGAVLGADTVDAAGEAELEVADLGVGTHAVTAEYGGDGDFASSATAAAVTQTVAKAATRTTASASAASSTAGDTVTFTAKVQRADGRAAAVPGGSVTFSDGATVLGTATLDDTGDATFRTSDLAVGDHSVSVSYAGSDRYGASASASAATHAVSARPIPQPPGPSGPQGDAGPSVPQPVATTRLAISHRTIPRAGSYIKFGIHCRGARGASCTGTLALDPASGTTRLAASGRYGRAKFDVAAGSDGALRVKASSGLLRALKRKRKVIVIATASFTGSSTATLTIERKITVVEPRRGR